MKAGVTSFKSILDRPLSQLTEDDISQLTREDCRKYLKEKGMRRPSWNKSQAIQQVISLKALLETSEDSGAGALRRILVSRPPIIPNKAESVLNELSIDANNRNSTFVEENAPIDSPSSSPSQQRDNFIDSRSPCTGGASVGQMTIFYSGKVNIYDGVQPDKAHTIMHLAASPNQFTLNDPICGTSTHSFPCHLQTPGEKHGIAPSGATDFQNFQSMQSEKMKESSRHFRETANTVHDPDGQVSRKVSLQRYLEKRKERGRFKIRKYLGPISSSLEVCMNHQERTPTFDGQSMRSSTNSPSSSELPNALGASSDNQANVSRFSVDLNEDVEEH